MVVLRVLFGVLQVRSLAEIANAPAELAYNSPDVWSNSFDATGGTIDWVDTDGCVEDLPALVVDEDHFVGSDTLVLAERTSFVGTTAFPRLVQGDLIVLVDLPLEVSLRTSLVPRTLQTAVVVLRDVAPLLRVAASGLHLGVRSRQAVRLLGAEPLLFG